MRLAPMILLLGVLLSMLRHAPAVAAPAPTLRDKCERVLAGWQQRFDAEHLHYVVAPPFVIAGDGSAAQIARYRDGTVLAATRALQATYFQAKPHEPIVILLFESAEPYRRLARKWFGDDDVPHFGFCRRDGVMLMNVGTGTGTLVHELVHALLRPDFPQAPDWFNEGLASLYEQCTLGDKTIRGLENWRLPALQQAIRSQSLRPVSELVQDRDFYQKQKVGLNYAQARYLLFYLQEKGLLTRYYSSFRAAVAAGKDPTGLATLRQVVGPQSLGQFERDWRAWVLGLRFE